jgi:hypothetical protein
MSTKRFDLNQKLKPADNRFGFKARLVLKTVVIPIFLLGALAVGTPQHSIVTVQADDCSSAWMNLEGCYYTCGGVSDFSQRVGCYGNCEFSHAQAGAACNLPSYSPMMTTGNGCDPTANGQRAYDNCMAGTLGGYWQEQYLNYLAYYNDMETACGMVQWSVEGQGC